MTDIYVKVNLAGGPGVDVRLLFPGSIAEKTSGYGYNDTEANFSYTDKSNNEYTIKYTGSKFAYTNIGLSVGGNITGATLYEDGGDTQVELASISITDPKGNPTSVAMPSAADFTQNSPQNNVAGATVHLSETGYTGADKLYGGEYADILSGYGGHDTLTGGGGHDQFDFIASGTSTYDFVTDFTRGQDKLVLDASLRNFPGLHNSTLANVFHDITTSSETASDRLLYNHDTGAFFYDRDGAGGKAPTEIAVLTNHAHISYSDIKVIG